MDFPRWLKNSWPIALAAAVIVGLLILIGFRSSRKHYTPTVIYDAPVTIEQPVVYDENPQPILASSPEDEAGHPPELTSYSVNELGGYEGYSDEALSDDGWNFSLSIMSANRQAQPEVAPPSQVSQAALYLAQQHWNDSIRSERDPYTEFSFERF